MVDIKLPTTIPKDRLEAVLAVVQCIAKERQGLSVVKRLFECGVLVRRSAIPGSWKSAPPAHVACTTLFGAR
jgi:hypothetical protein